MRAKKFLSTIFLGFTLMTPWSAFALTGPSVTLSLNPTNPNPNELVSVSVSAYEFNIDMSKISWTVDGKKTQEGTGLKSITLTAPANGKTTNVSVSVTTPASLIIQKSIAISPADIDLIWEVVDGYAPPFYKGKVLPVKESSIRVMAMPNVKLSSGKSSQPGDFVYVWKKDGENLAGQSGFGKNSLFFTNQILDTQNQIDVSASNGSKQVLGTITIKPFAPDLVFYEDDSNLGIKYQKALNSGDSLKNLRLAIVAEPYNLLKDFKENANAKIDWTVNNQKFAAQTKNEIILNTANTSGVSVLASYNETNRLFRNFSGNLNLSIRK